MPLYKISEKKIIITGSQGQLGSHLASFLASLGADVIRVDQEDFDITNEKETRRFFSDVFSAKGKIDVLINNAGVSTFEPFLERSEESFKWVSDVNLRGTFNCIKSYVSEFDKSAQDQGSIINVGSVYGIVSPDPRIYTDCERRNSEVYGASKAGIIQMTKYFAVHLASRNITVNSVSPGGIFNPKDPQGGDFISRYSSRCPMNRMANVDDMDGAFLFFSSDMSRYITGQNLTVDGGFSIW
tara:strand:- start:376 stop:1098 length:723 start_codon:yes stop_codon:yes gene_type:complete